MEFKVTVEKRLYCSGILIIEADNPDDAIEKAQALMDREGTIEDEIDWDDPMLEPGSMEVTGDVE